MALPKGLKVSINNTPQGTTDDRDWGEAVAGTIQFVDVLANDLGGGSTTVYGLWNGALPLNLGDLLTPGVLTQQFTAIGAGHTGATISIVDNQLKYDFTGLSYDSLAQGQVVQDVFFYVLRMGNGAFAVAKVDVSITGENDTPTIDSNGGGDTASVLVPENTSTVTTVHATDPDNGASLTYTIVGGADSSAFTINLTSGQLTFNSAPNYESPTDTGANNTYEVQVQVSDGLGGIDTQTITVDVTDVNEAPNAGTDFSASAAENVGDAVVLADVNATDPDDQGGGGNDATNDFENLKYSITGGNGAGLFEIDADTGQISLASGQQLNYESANQHVLTVKVQDQNGTGLSDTVDVTINVTDVNEAPSLAVDATPVSVNEGTVPATPIADVDGTDPDLGGGNDLLNNFENLTYSIQSVDGFTSGTTYNLFTINSGTGEISLASALDFETDASYSLVVRVTDGPGLFDEETVVVNVNDVPENVAPVAGNDKWIISQGATFTIPLSWLLSNDTDSNGDTLSITGNSTLPTWMTANYTGGKLVSISVNNAVLGDGTEQFTYTLSDGTTTTTGTVDVVLKAVGTGTTADTINLSGETYDYSYINTNNGNDTQTAGSGIDSLIGGDGVDTIKITAPTSDVIDGSANGNSNLAINTGDILVFDGNLDLTAVPQTSISNIETISMSDTLGGAASDDLTLDANDVINMGTGTFDPTGALNQQKAIRVNGDATDDLNLAGGGWQLATFTGGGGGDPAPAGYTAWVHDSSGTAGIQPDAYILVQSGINVHLI